MEASFDDTLDGKWLDSFQNCCLRFALCRLFVSGMAAPSSTGWGRPLVFI